VDLREDRPFLGVNHVSVVTADLEATIRTWFDKYGIGPWELYTYDDTMIRAHVDGEETTFGMRAGFCHLDPTTRIEIIEPLDDRSPYAASLAKHGGANHVHHLRLDVADSAASRERLTALGTPRVLDGEFAGAAGTSSTAIYFDTAEDLGFLVEVADLPAGYQRIAPDGHYP
jgi:catechol 2,3-dioxygenase-like lactoylglutathione lyase family enzyme